MNPFKKITIVEFENKKFGIRKTWFWFFHRYYDWIYSEWKPQSSKGHIEYNSYGDAYNTAMLKVFERGAGFVIREFNE